jgi:hypothetical protein
MPGISSAQGTNGPNGEALNLGGKDEGKDLQELSVANQGSAWPPLAIAYRIWQAMWQAWAIQ